MASSGARRSLNIEVCLTFYARRNEMIIGERLRELREHKKLSQGDIEKRTGLLRCYISRVENGHNRPRD